MFDENASPGYWEVRNPADLREKLAVVIENSHSHILKRGCTGVVVVGGGGGGVDYLRFDESYI